MIFLRNKALRYKKFKLRNALFNRCRCRTAEICTDNYITIKNHKHSKLDMECIYCHDSSRMWNIHEDSSFQGLAVECAKCYNYIFYPDNKHELYLDDLNIYVISNLEGYEVFNSVGDISIMKIPHFDFDSMNHLRKKIKTYVVLS